MLLVLNCSPDRPGLTLESLAATRLSEAGQFATPWLAAQPFQSHSEGNQFPLARLRPDARYLPDRNSLVRTGRADCVGMKSRQPGCTARWRGECVFEAIETSGAPREWVILMSYTHTRPITGRAAGCSRVRDKVHIYRDVPPRLC